MTSGKAFSPSVGVQEHAAASCASVFHSVYLSELPNENAFSWCLLVERTGERLVFLITDAVVFGSSIWGGRGADTFVSSCPTATDWSIYLPSGAENAVSVNDAIFVPAGWDPVSFNT